MAGLGGVKVFKTVQPVRENLYFTHAQERTWCWAWEKKARLI